MKGDGDEDDENRKVAQHAEEEIYTDINTIAQLLTY